MRLTGSGLPLWWRALLLVPLRSHEELASAMDKLTTSAELRRGMGAGRLAPPPQRFSINAAGAVCRSVVLLN